MVKNVHLFKCSSDRTNEKGQKYTDLFVAYETDKKSYLVRVRPCFATDLKLLMASATDIEVEDNYLKYM